MSLIKSNYDGMTCKIIHEGQLSRQFPVPGCLLSSFLFLLVTDWIIKMTTRERGNEIEWTLWSKVDGLDFADHLAFTFSQPSINAGQASRLMDISAQVGLRIHKQKTRTVSVLLESSH